MEAENFINCRRKAASLKENGYAWTGPEYSEVISSSKRNPLFFGYISLKDAVSKKSHVSVEL